jgi:hypothetical protein
MRGDPESAVGRFAESIELFRSANDQDGVAVQTHNLGRANLKLGRLDPARDALRESIEVGRRLGYREVIAYCLGGLAELAMLEDDAGWAATMLGASQHVFGEIGAALDPEEAESQQRVAAFAAEKLGPARADELRAAGATVDLGEGALDGV